jgi:hypothetical protein
MIPSELAEFLSAPRWCVLGMVDAKGRPSMAQCLGWKLGPPGGPDLVLFLRTDLTSVLPGKGATDQITALMNESERFVAYQMKGRGRTRPATPEEVQMTKEMMASLGETTEQHWGLPASLYTTIPVEPMIAVEMEVEVAFAQSPGTGAGNQIGGAR